uniref:F-box domain-containing protein n=1 Tax=Rhabditophanes sp. KR3021 TaxID=114890 RepID=A0AC35U7Y2_9BILA
MVKFTPAQLVALNTNVMHKVIYNAATNYATLNSISKTCGRFWDYTNDIRLCFRYRHINTNIILTFVNLGEIDKVSVLLKVGNESKCFESLSTLRRHVLEKKYVCSQIIFIVDLTYRKEQTIKDIIYVMNYCLKYLFHSTNNLYLVCMDYFSRSHYYQILGSIQSNSVEVICFSEVQCLNNADVEIENIVKNFPNLKGVEPRPFDKFNNFDTFAERFKFIIELITRNRNICLLFEINKITPQYKWLLENIDNKNKEALDFIKEKSIPTYVLMALGDQQFNFSGVMEQLLKNVKVLALSNVRYSQQLSLLSKQNLSELNMLEIGGKLCEMNNPINFAMELNTLCKKLSNLSNFKHFKLYNMCFNDKSAELGYEAIFNLSSELETLCIIGFAQKCHPSNSSFVKKFPNLRKLTVQEIFLKNILYKKETLYNQSNVIYGVEFLKPFKNLEAIRMSCGSHLNIFIPNSVMVLTVVCNCKLFFHPYLNLENPSMCSKFYSDETRCVCLVAQMQFKHSIVVTLKRGRAVIYNNDIFGIETRDELLEIY